VPPLVQHSHGAKNETGPFPKEGPGRLPQTSERSALDLSPEFGSHAAARSQRMAATLLQ
jgi:hypothetical protein